MRGSSLDYMRAWAFTVETNATTPLHTTALIHHVTLCCQALRGLLEIGSTLSWHRFQQPPGQMQVGRRGTLVGTLCAAALCALYVHTCICGGAYEQNLVLY
jgi:hypothetical protein